MHVIATEEDILSEREFQEISDLIYSHCGINLHDGKRELVRARLAKQLRTGGYETVRQYLDKVKSDSTGEALRGLADSLSTNLTSFFREIAHFDFLREKFLPDLIAKRRATRSPIVAWSAGCSSGEEPYTLAMVLSEAVADTGVPIKLLATDISRRVLNTAMAGQYEAHRLDPVPAQMRSRYFNATKQAGSTYYEAGAALRGLIRFRYLNLLEPWPFNGTFDFIFCRNVMIYFDKQTQQRVISRFSDALNAGGMLFTGHSESLTGIQHKLRYVQPTIYQKA